MNPALAIPDRALGLLLGCAVGDALGVPAETMTREEIRAAFGRRTSYHACAPSHPYTAGWPAGKWTDDTQLSLAVARALTADTFDLGRLAAEHIAEYARCTKGWGKGTRGAVERLRDGVSPERSGNPDGGGNGVLMKLAPLALFHACRPDIDVPARETQLERFVRMTHDTPVALVTAAVHHGFLLAALDVSLAEFEHLGVRRYLVERARLAARRLEKEYGQKEDLVSERLERLLSSDLGDDALVEISDGGTLYAPDSLTMCYGVLLRGSDFVAVADAANMGGDTDSNAAIVGATLGMLRGPGFLPPALVEGLWHGEEVVTTARAFGQALAILKK